MAIVTWGMLAKSQVDSEKIEEAIARLVAEHNEDEEAHLGAGQSLQSHKSFAIIDHLVRSIVADKFSDKQMIFQTTFESLDAWTVEASLVNNKWPGVVFGTSAVQNDEALLSSASAGIPDFLNPSKNLLFQVSLKIDNDSNVEWYADWGVYSGNFVGESAFGFMYTNGQLKAFYHDGTDLHSANINGINTENPHIYRAVIDSTKEEINYYIDGVLVATIDCTDWTFSENRSATFEIKTLTTSLRRMYINYLMLARDI